MHSNERLHIFYNILAEREKPQIFPNSTSLSVVLLFQVDSSCSWGKWFESKVPCSVCCSLLLYSPAHFNWPRIMSSSLCSIDGITAHISRHRWYSEVVCVCVWFFGFYTSKSICQLTGHWISFSRRTVAGLFCAKAAFPTWTLPS